MEVRRGRTNGLFHTSKHHHVLEVPLDLVPSAEIEDQGERVDVERPPDEDGNLTETSRTPYPDKTNQKFSKPDRQQNPSDSVFQSTNPPH